MRSDLTSAGASNVETDLDDKTCLFEVDKGMDVTKLLDELASKNNKIQDWTIQN